MPTEPLIERVRRYLPGFSPQSGHSSQAGDDQANPFGAWVRLESDGFVIGVVRDRGQEWITVMVKARPRPRAPRRCWPLAHLLAYLDCRAEPYAIGSLEAEAGLLTRRAGEVLDATL